MRYCTHCGHEIKVGRFCTNCGQPVSVPADANAPAAPAVTPQVPPPGSVPPAPRYPLYAETVAPPPTPAPPPPVRPSAHPSTPARSAAPPATPARGRRDWLPWLIVVLFLAVLAAGGSVLLLLDSGDDERPTADTGNARGGDDDELPDDPPGGEPGGQGDLTAKADAEAPAVAPPSRDNQGNQVTFAADNMLDGDPRTSWRMAGDGTDAVLTFTFDDTVEIDEVGLINGYAKTDSPNDWYVANRRILSVSWVFDDGTEVTQDLEESRSLQTMGIDPVETSQVQLRILEVSPPGRGPSGRDFTAVSDVAFGGSGD